MARLAWCTAAAALLAPCDRGEARINGIVDYSGKQGITCSTHHDGGVAPLVRFEGPSVVAVRELATFRFVVVSQSAEQRSAGFNVAASDGALAAGSGSKLERDELTHTTPRAANDRGESAWQFTWRAPATRGNQTLFGAGNSVDGFIDEEGDDATATSMDVDVRCLGDCGNDAAVGIDELIRGVGAALGAMPLGACAAIDGNGSGQVSIAELARAVRNALDGCE